MVINYSCVHTQDTCAFLQADMYDIQIDHKVTKVISFKYLSNVDFNIDEDNLKTYSYKNLALLCKSQKVLYSSSSRLKYRKIGSITNSKLYSAPISMFFYKK